MNEHQHHQGHHHHRRVTEREAPQVREASEGAGAGEFAIQSEAVAAIYTCPMHPQIRRPAPGNCPICGMALEPEMPAVEEEKNPELEDFTRRFWWTLPLSVIAVLLAMLGHRFVPLAPGAMSWV